MWGTRGAAGGQGLVTYRLTVAEFRALLDVILSPAAPDPLTNLVLMACTRPREGVIRVPVPEADAAVIADLVGQAASVATDLLPLAGVLRSQLERELS